MERSMDRSILMGLVLAFLLVLLALMLFGWRRRQQRQRNLPRPLRLPADWGSETMTTSAFYVATTVAREPLNRIAVAGLGYRARAAVGITAHGLRLAIPGQSAAYIPAADLRAVERATWAIDRAVEQGGLILIRWQLGDPATDGTQVDSYFRITDPATASRFFDSVQQLHDRSTQTGGREQ
jgi:hypothetical protein